MLVGASPRRVAIVVARASHCTRQWRLRASRESGDVDRRLRGLVDRFGLRGQRVDESPRAQS